MSPSGAGVYGSGLAKTASGCPSVQSASNTRGAGSSARFPSGAPLSTHLPIRSISLCVSTRGSTNSPQPSTGFHGGIWCVFVISLMSSACGAASAYVISENGAMSPG